MGQCLALFWPRATTSSRSKEYINAANVEDNDEMFQHQEPSRLTKQLEGKRESVTRKLSGIFSLTRTRPKNNAYVLQNDEDEAHIELYDMVADPKFFTGADPHQDHLPKMIPNHPQPDLRQVVGLRNTLTCCVLPNRQYGKLDNEYMDHSMDTSGGTAFIVLNPRRLNGHATIPAPPMTCPSALAAHHSKWSINSANSLEDHERSHHAPSIDLEWENDDVLVEAASAIGKAKNDNNRQTVEQKNCDLDTCSISTTVPCTRGSRASSHISIPGLDWDSQVDNDDLVSLNNAEMPEADFETEQLISEIELLTSRALQETGHQIIQGGSPAKKSSTSTLLE
eukprot:10824.XXX_566094_548508_1 [CDS] Oithona nana genome sequencing.